MTADAQSWCRTPVSRGFITSTTPSELGRNDPPHRTPVHAQTIASSCPAHHDGQLTDLDTSERRVRQLGDSPLASVRTAGTLG